MAYKVAKGASILLRGKHLLEGAEVPSGLKSLHDHIRSGHVVKTDSDGLVEGEAKDAVESPTVKPGTEVREEGGQLPGGPSPSAIRAVEQAMKSAAGERSIEVITSTKPEKPVPGPKAEAVGRWNVNPTILKGKTLEQLNVMVLERDKAVEPFTTIEEAAAQLSADFKS